MSKQMKAEQQAGEKVDWKARGAPHVCLFVAVLRFVIDDTSKDGNHPNEKYYATLRGFWADVVFQSTATQIGELVTHFRYKKARNDAPEPRVGVLSVCVQLRATHMPAVWETLTAYFLQSANMSRLAGPAPKGPLERDLERVLETGKGRGKGK
eukprot:3227945-Pyramimonas_sp.AAC.1